MAAVADDLAPALALRSARRRLDDGAVLHVHDMWSVRHGLSQYQQGTTLRIAARSAADSRFFRPLLYSTTKRGVLSRLLRKKVKNSVRMIRVLQQNDPVRRFLARLGAQRCLYKQKVEERHSDSTWGSAGKGGTGRQEKGERSADHDQPHSERRASHVAGFGRRTFDDIRGWTR